MVETDVLAEVLAQPLIGLLGAPHRIADHQRAAAVDEGLLQERDQSILRKPSDPDCAASSRRGRDDLGAILTSSNQAGEGSVYVLRCGTPADALTRCQTQAPSVGVDHGGASGLGQCGRQEHHRHPVGCEPGQDPVQVDVHVRGVGVHLVDNDDLARQPQVSHGQVRGTHCPEQQVVHGGDDEVRQHRLLAPAEPGQDRQVGSAAVLEVCGTARSSLILIPSDPDRAWGLAGRVVKRSKEPVADLITAASQKLRLLVESGPSVQELSGELRRRPLVGVGLLNVLQPVELAGEHGVRRRLGG